MKSPLYELQKAIFGRLAALSCPAYDAVPQDAVFPYVTIGEDTGNNWSSKIEPGQEVTTTLHAWSRYNGMAEVKQIMGEVIQSLTSGPLVLTGFYVVVSGLEFNEVMVDSDGTTRHGILRFRYKIEEVD